ncbi:DNA-directed RNA polymerase I subunit 1 isoform X2 [Magnolia sinica]|uniref:DNA-directed RNA polymerase I subunit 1 isoform X2 n=1 Tax=Magnolia sinica TaxID=86752 RepID=UPI00265B6DF3|nr:DNA-directed RNA polymerase I subunit 1 isoform X2 [Magnolia sinica]
MAQPQTSEGATESIDSVFFSFFTDEEVRSHSFKKITSPVPFDDMSRPVPGGLYDQALGPVDDGLPCKSCGQNALLCPGHCGHIDLVAPVYNPLLFRILHTLIRKACFFCHHFRLRREKVQAYASQLDLIIKGDTVRDLCEEEDGVTDTSVHTKERCSTSNWTSFQYHEVKSILNKFMGENFKKCQNCGANNPKITSPTFGWFQMDDMLNADTRANIIKGCKLDETFVRGAEPRSFMDGDAQNADDSMLGGNSVESHDTELSGAVDDGMPGNASIKHKSKGGPLPPEFLKQRKLLSGPLLPSEVKNLLKLLWENEARLCLLIFDIQQQSLFMTGKSRSSSMFFIEALLVPPNKFRPPSRKNGMEVEHPQSVLLSTVLQLNLSLGKAYMNNSEREKIVNRWMNLQETINVLFDSRKAIRQKDRGTSGICQLIEKKEGIFRQKMMGKRVNFACRSVISPDPYLAVNEIGIPPYFAVKLTYPEPTLHKPSMMAHVVRVLKGEKTLRMHYANCSTYNADFDGDEMNVHFPQDEISRAEAIEIANANKQYIVPTSGAPIRGLIQDHIVSAVLLTKKDTFLTRDEYHMLLYASGVSTAASGSYVGKFGQKVCTLSSDDEIQPLPPVIWKPKPLWTGKQVITTILNHITRGRPPFTVKKEGKIEDGCFYSEWKEGNMVEGCFKHCKSKGKKHKLIIWKNELVHGVIDKNQFAKYGMVHTVQEFYGSNTAGILLSVLSRLFTVFLQMHGFTCGVDDLLIVQHSDLKRKMILEKHENTGANIHSKFIGAKIAEPVKLQMEIERAIRSHGESAVTYLDMLMSHELNGVTTEINDAIIPNGLLKPFPRNCLSLMTTTGAKGSQVNFTQISSLLGQQQLEGKRVPRMVSGKTLPCFPPWDTAARAGGFIGDRFLTGLRPQEYYFHCMAGREGLVDTAIKTSRSGYLQRCLIKNLECLRVCYDHTVRDADGSVVQFCYGEDGVDVHKASFITEFKLLAQNQRIILEKLSGQHEDASNCYVNELPDALRGKAKDFIGTLSKKKRDSLHLRKQKNLTNLVKFKYLSSLAQPGEAVGVLAAQSVGEPSTQMTLNTFHHAGQGEMNVTLGIPRLQEILQRASAKIRTPIMTCPLRKGTTRAEAERLAAKLKMVSVADIVESMEVCVVPFSVHQEGASTIYKLKMKLFPPELYPPYSDITLEDCEETLEVLFIRELEDSIQSHIKMLSKIRGIKAVTNSEEHNTTKETSEEEPGSISHQVGEEEDDDGGGEGDEVADDLGGDAQKRKRQAKDEMDYDDGMESEVPIVEDELKESKQSTGFESEIDQVEDDGDYTLGGESEIMEGEDQIFDAEDEAPGSPSKPDYVSKLKESNSELKPKAKQRKGRGHLIKKKTDRAILVVINGLKFEAHFCFRDEPHILLAQIAQKAAKKVYVKRSENIDRCSVIGYEEDNKKGEGTPSLQTAGVNFRAFWNLQDNLDIRNIVSNDIYAMLNTYGVEAARATILKEVYNVFKPYAISIDIRHLTLIADYMTADGGYRPMNRFGMADSSTSPLCKMSFETATKFIVEAALHGEVERLESPSARICLGLPVKMGTGCFDLMHNLEA